MPAVSNVSGMQLDIASHVRTSLASVIAKAAPADPANAGMQHHNNRADLQKLVCALDLLTQCCE